ncbi:hypothetical protein EXE43_11890 [Halorubrum sp. SS5]|nr:hypothetical protein EXE43_11890 [Halorubrum sp. SS5]
MQGEAARTNMSGLDFESTWRVTDGYPALRTLSGTEPGEAPPAAGTPLTVNASASSVSPTTAAVGDSQTYTVTVTVENTWLNDTEARDIEVRFEEFEFDTGGDDLTIGYNATDVTNGTVTVSETVSATPVSTGLHDVTVTDIRRGASDEAAGSLLADANVTIDTIEVVDAPDGPEAPPEAEGISFVPGGGSSSFGRNGSRAYAAKIVVATPSSGGVAIGDANSRAFRVVQTDTDTNESVVVEPEPGVGTYNVTGASFEIYRPNGTVGYSDPLADRGPALRVRLANGSTTEIPVAVSGNRNLFDPSRAGSSVFDSYAVQLLAENTTQPSDSSVLAETEPRVRGIGYDGGPGTASGLRQNSTEGTIEVSINREPDVNASWHVEYVVASSPNALLRNRSADSVLLNRSVDNTDAAANLTATFGGRDLRNGSYLHAFVIRPTERSDEVYLTLIGENLRIGGARDGPGDGGDDSQVDIDPSDLAGNGTEADPYRIANASELQAMADDLNANYTLITDVNASNTVQWNDGRGFDPIGGDASNRSSLPAFTGTFDGDGHTVTGLAIDRPNETYTGLFGSLESGTVEDVALADHAVTGESQVGSLVGVSRNSTITNVTTAGLVRGTGRLVGGTVGISRTSTLANVTASGDVVGANSPVGGLTGSVVQTSTVRDVTVTSEVSGPDQVGGLAGFNSAGSAIRRATVSADVQGAVRVGGLVGENQGTIRTATVSGTVNGSNQLGGLVGGAFTGQTMRNTTASSTVTGSDFVGGLVGYTFGDIEIRNATATGEVSGAEDVGGLIGRSADDTTVRASTASGTVNGSDNVGGLIGLSFDDTTVRASTASGTVRGSSSVGGVVGFATDRTVVRDSTTSSAVDGVEVVGGLVGRAKSNSTFRYSRATGAVNASTFVGGFAGSVSGNSTVRASTASGAVTGSGQQVGGFAGDVDGTGTVRNVTATGNVAAANAFVGGLVGFASDDSTIQGSQASGDVTGPDAVGGAVGILTDSATIQRTTASGRVDGVTEVGGLVGDMDFRSAIRNSTASGDVNGSSRVGGLVGGIDGDGNTVRNAAASGAVNGSEDVGGLVGYNGQDNTIRDAFAVGPVTGSVDSGGVTGRSFGAVADAYWDEQATGQNTTGGSAVGLTTAQMRGQAARANMSGLDFNTTWQVTNGYPTLRVSPESDDSGDTDGLVPFPRTTQPGQTTPPSLAGQFRVEQSVAGATSITLLQDAASEYSINITAPDGSENVTFYLQERAVSASQDIDDVRMLLDGQPRPFTVVAAAGPGNSSWIAFTVPEFSTRTVTFTSESASEDAALSITAPSDATYDPNSELTIGTRHNATGVIDDSDAAIRVVNATAGNNTELALNDSVPVAGSANTTIPAGSLAGNVTVEAQLYNLSSETVVAADTISLVADTGSDDGGSGGGGDDGGSGGGGDDGSGGGNETDGGTGTPSFAVSELVPQDVTITAGDTLTVTATVENVGNASGTQTVEYRIGGATMANATVTLSPGENTTVEFTDIGTTNLVADEYAHGVFTENASQTGTLTVEAETSGGTDDSTPGFGSVAALLALLLFVVVATRRGD